ncbi:hypothetical protein [Nocardia sp. NPDC127526]|uniref:hypothetical protein n=1 Tax=Nocardia sp. NPDC127526 TaxID=3345393 RepID=UPI0036268732
MHIEYHPRHLLDALSDHERTRGYSGYDITTGECPGGWATAGWPDMLANILDHLTEVPFGIFDAPPILAGQSLKLAYDFIGDSYEDFTDGLIVRAEASNGYALPMVRYTDYNVVRFGPDQWREDTRLRLPFDVAQAVISDIDHELQRFEALYRYA